MSRHLTPEQLVDLAEGVQPESSAPHLTACDTCRRQLADMRAMMSATAGVEAHEPSPLFWDHLSARVHEAVAEEAARPRLWRERLLRPLVLVPGFGAAIAVAVIAIALPRGPVSAPAPAIPSSPLVATVTVPAPRPSMPPLAPFGSADDPQLRIVAGVATTVAWDEMMDEVAMATSGTSDAVAASLTADEQRELQRLLTEAMAQANAPEKRS